MSTSLLADRITLYHSGDEYYDAALERIRQAQEEILFETYIFENDAVGTLFLQELSQAAARGVQVFLLVDAIGSYNLIRLQREIKALHNIHFRIYHPLPFQMRWSWLRLGKFLSLLQKVNNRNHRKLLMVDEKFVFVGSCNISVCHSQKNKGSEAWRDSHVQFEFLQPNQETELVKKAFFDAWRLHRGPSPLKLTRLLKNHEYWKQPKSLYFRLNSRIHWRYAHLHQLNQKIARAQKRVFITNAYFVPQRSLFHSLCFAARRGVEVCLCLPKKTDVWLVLQASRSLYAKLLKEGVKIYEYEPSVLHAKTMIIDDNWAVVGSHNMNHRSFFHDLEIEAVLTQESLIENLMQQWTVDTQNSHILTQSDLNKLSLLNKIISAVMYAFRYWL